MYNLILVCHVGVTMLLNTKKITLYLSALVFSMSYSIGNAANMDESLNSQKAYPDSIQTMTEDEIVWIDETTMPVSDSKNNQSQQDELDIPSLDKNADI